MVSTTINFNIFFIAETIHELEFLQCLLLKDIKYNTNEPANKEEEKHTSIRTTVLLMSPSATISSRRAVRSSTLLE
jgi:hypothetical protein